MLMSVVSPASTILMLTRVAPGRRSNRSAIPLAAHSASNGAALSAPTSPNTVTGTPQSARQLATFTPLPPGSCRTERARCTSPRTNRSMVTVWSMAGLNVTVATRKTPAITDLPH